MKKKKIVDPRPGIDQNSVRAHENVHVCGCVLWRGVCTLMALDVWLELRPGIDPKTLQEFKLCKRPELSVFVRSQSTMELFFFVKSKKAAGHR